MVDEAEYDRWLDAIEQHGRNLTPWEADFIESIRLQRDRHRPLTERQVETLERIYTDRTP